MITIHWNIIVFIIILLAIIWKMAKYSEPIGYGAEIGLAFWLIILIAFVALWGGIFWW